MFEPFKSELSATEKLEASRRELLDLSLGNPLLNHRPTRARGVEVVDELPSEVFRILVREGKAMTFEPAPEKNSEQGKDDVEDGAYGLDPAVAPAELAQPNEEDEPGKLASRHVDLRLQTALSSQRLQSKLLKTEREAKIFMEEQGTNVLFLALGMLTWFESGSSSEPHRAPLLLVPVSLERASVQQRFRLIYAEEEVGENLSLATKIKLGFGLTLPELPDHEDIEIDAYFDAVEEALQGQPGWSVDRGAVVVDFFSFAKFLMYRDLDEEKWPEGEGPTQHPIISSLLDGEPVGSTPQLSEEENVDRHQGPGEAHQVVDADSSQVLTLLDAKRGCNLVVQGPPGTGKSQTITNLIAEAVGQGKSVLFVSEKMAALEVVKRRLDSVGLGDACLELHSRKTRKTALLQELGRTLALGEPRMSNSEDELQVMGTMRDRLNDYCEAVNTEIGESGFTPHEAIGELVRQGEEGTGAPRFDFEPMRGWNRTEFKRKETLVEQLRSRLQQMGPPARNPFYGTTLTVLLPTEQRRIEELIGNALQATTRLRSPAQELARLLGLDSPEDRFDAESLYHAVRRAGEVQDLGVDIRREEWATRKEDLGSLLGAGLRRAELHEQYGEILIPEAWERDLLEIREIIAARGRKRSWERELLKVRETIAARGGLRALSGKYRKAYNTLAGLCYGGAPEDVEGQLDLIDAVLEAQSCEKTIRDHEDLGSELFGALWKGESSEWQKLSKATQLLAGTQYLTGLHEEIRDGRLPAALLDSLAENPDREALRAQTAELGQALEAHRPAVEKAMEKVGFAAQEEQAPLADRSFEIQAYTLEGWLRNLDQLQQMALYNQLVETLYKEGLGTVVEGSRSWEGADTGLMDAFRYTWFEGLVEQAFRERPTLSGFDRGDHEHFVEKFRELDRLTLEYNRMRLAHAHWQSLPKHGAGGQLGVLRREIEKKRRHLPIRQLIKRAGKAIQGIKPVFMMSPISIANFIEPGSLSFDLVVFDEASQVKPVEAMGAIARGRQAVVVGDNKQLPPTSFFDSLLNTEEAGEGSVTGDLESILGLFVATGCPERMLRWHYRSRHESLIAVSNRELYNDGLTVFPSPDRDSDDLGLAYYHLPETTYDRGGSRTNPGEAQAVAEAVMEHASNRHHLTLGVASFSASQAQAIEDRLEILRRKDPSCEEFFASQTAEPFFVKNLENIQGDERDVIFISVGYGRDASGYLSMSFGPLNQEGGERRLNVLITRARRACKVFTNLTPDDIDLGRTSSRGVEVFKSFLQYAKDGTLDLSTPTGEPDSPFEESVLSELHKLGYRVDSQVGSAGFFLDLAVVDPEAPGRYLLGIECDGAAYHSARSARDRDRLRQEVLEGLGWRIHRIWSTNWFRAPNRELKRVAEAIEEARLYAGTQELPEPTGPPKQTRIPRETENPVGEQESTKLLAYEMASPKVGTYGELHRLPSSELAEVVTEVVKVESPVHIDEVIRRITDAASVSRAGKRIQNAVNEAVGEAAAKGEITRSGKFLWRVGMREAPLRDRNHLPNRSRKVELIAPREVEAAVEKVVEDSFGIEKTEIPAQVLNLLLGFKRTSASAHQQVTDIIDDMVDRGRLSESDGHITRE